MFCLDHPIKIGYGVQICHGIFLNPFIPSLRIWNGVFCLQSCPNAPLLLLLAERFNKGRRRTSCPFSTIYEVSDVKNSY